VAKCPRRRAFAMSIKKRYDLMIPGPVSVEDEVLAEMAQPIVAH